MHKFTILTPTFNRANLLPKVYNYLCQQVDMDLEWIVVDDGSSDNTKEIVNSFDKKFEIKYLYQEHLGLPSAMNLGTKNADSYIILKHDDDDILLPGALKTVWNYFDPGIGKFKYNCVCLAGLCRDENGKILGKRFPQDNYVSDFIRCIKNKNITGDKSEFFITEIYKKYPLPVFENEKNIAPSTIHTRIAFDHKTLYINEILQEKEFLEGGLSSFNYSLKYPLGSELRHNESSIPPHGLLIQIKQSGKYIYFAKINKKKHIFKNAKNKLIYPIGFLAFVILKFIFLLKKTPFSKNFIKSKKSGENNIYTY